MVRKNESAGPVRGDHSLSTFMHNNLNNPSVSSLQASSAAKAQAVLDSLSQNVLSFDVAEHQSTLESLRAEVEQLTFGGGSPPSRKLASDENIPPANSPSTAPVKEVEKSVPSNSIPKNYFSDALQLHEPDTFKNLRCDSMPSRSRTNSPATSSAHISSHQQEEDRLKLNTAEKIASSSSEEAKEAKKEWIRLVRVGADIENSNKIRVEQLKERFRDTGKTLNSIESDFKKSKGKVVQRIRNYKMQLSQLTKKKTKLQEDDSFPLSEDGGGVSSGQPMQLNQHNQKQHNLFKSGADLLRHQRNVSQRSLHQITDQLKACERCVDDLTKKKESCEKRVESVRGEMQTISNSVVELDICIIREEDNHRRIEKEKNDFRKRLQDEINELESTISEQETEAGKLKRKLELCVGGLRACGKDFESGEGAQALNELRTLQRYIASSQDAEKHVRLRQVEQHVLSQQVERVRYESETLEKDWVARRECLKNAISEKEGQFQEILQVVEELRGRLVSSQPAASPPADAGAQEHESPFKSSADLDKEALEAEFATQSSMLNLRQAQVDSLRTRIRDGEIEVDQKLTAMRVWMEAQKPMLSENIKSSDPNACARHLELNDVKEMYNHRMRDFKIAATNWEEQKSHRLDQTAKVRAQIAQVEAKLMKLKATQRSKLETLSSQLHSDRFELLKIDQRKALLDRKKRESLTKEIDAVFEQLQAKVLGADVASKGGSSNRKAKGKGRGKNGYNMDELNLQLRKEAGVIVRKRRAEQNATVQRLRDEEQAALDELDTTSSELDKAVEVLREMEVRVQDSSREMKFSESAMRQISHAQGEHRRIRRTRNVGDTSGAVAEVMHDPVKVLKLREEIRPEPEPTLDEYDDLIVQKQEDLAKVQKELKGLTEEYQSQREGVDKERAHIEQMIADEAINAARDLEQSRAEVQHAASQFSALTKRAEQAQHELTLLKKQYEPKQETDIEEDGPKKKPVRNFGSPTSKTSRRSGYATSIANSEQSLPARQVKAVTEVTFFEAKDIFRCNRDAFDFFCQVHCLLQGQEVIRLPGGKKDLERTRNYQISILKLSQDFMRLSFAKQTLVNAKMRGVSPRGRGGETFLRSEGVLRCHVPAGTIELLNGEYLKASESSDQTPLYFEVVMKGREPLRLAIRGAQSFQLATQAINVLGKTMNRADATEFLSMVRCKLLNYEG